MAGPVSTRRKLEKSVEDRCVRLAKNKGWLVRKINGLGYRSWPDRLFIPPRKSKLEQFWVEFKRLGEVPTPLQEQVHIDLRVRGQRVYVIDTYDDFLKLI